MRAGDVARARAVVAGLVGAAAPTGRGKVVRLARQKGLKRRGMVGAMSPEIEAEIEAMRRLGFSRSAVIAAACAHFFGIRRA